MTLLTEKTKAERHRPRLAIIGAGLIGAAAARHLAKSGADVSLIGPVEPAVPAHWDGPHASHHDSGRITRALDAVPFWSEVARASIARYAQIEAEGGRRFYHPVGALFAADERSDWLADVSAVQAGCAYPADWVQGDALARRFPFFKFPDTWAAWHERADQPNGAGHINPRHMLAAQITAATLFGARHVAEVAASLEEHGDGVCVRLAQGETLGFDKVLVAAGGWSADLLPGVVDLTVYARTVALFRLDEAEAARLSAMPSVVSMLPDGNDPYVLPPIRYPDGGLYLKLGGDPQDVALSGKAEINTWFRSGGSASVADWLSDHLHAMIPGLRVEQTSRAACVTSFTPDGLPVLRNVTDRIAVAAGGCGKAAKSSDELGRMGAALLLDEPIQL